MGGKTGTTTQTVQIPPEVLARYNAVNLRAENVAERPFQQYSTDPNAFVAPLSQTQRAGVGQTLGSMNLAQPAYQAAMAGTGQTYQGYTPQGFQEGVAGYMSPFLSNALGATAAQMQNVAQQQQQDIIGKAIQSGAFGGDRGRIAQAALANQQNLAMGQTLGQMAQQGYQSAAQNYMTGLGQQGQLAAQMGALGAGAQTAGLQGGAAALAAGQPEQQTQQAGLTALYNQFLQGQAYPFQVAQFLANIAEGTGALSGSTTTTTQPLGFFSDERLKEDIEPIGKTFDGQNIIKFRYKNRPETHIGLSAQETEKHHPEAVGLAAGYKTVDYDKATKDAASMGGGVHPSSARQNFEMGGFADQSAGGMLPYAVGSGVIPTALNIPMSLPAARALALPSAPPTLKSGLAEMSEIADLASTGSKMYDWYKDTSKSLGSHHDDKDTNADRWEKARGGLVPEEEQSPQGINEPIKGLDIPNDRPELSSLPKPGEPPRMKSGLSDLSDIATIASVGMKAAPMVGEALSWLPMLFLATGGVAGRRRYATDGAVDDSTEEGVAAASTDKGAEPTLDNVLNASRAAIRRIESGGDYGITGKTTVRKDPKTGATFDDAPLGAYGVMRSNLGPWSREVFGKEVSEEDFLKDPKIQDDLFNAKFGSYVKKHGNPLDAASVWFSGRPLQEAVSAGNVPDILGTKPSGYVDMFAKYSGLGPAEASAKAPIVDKVADQKASRGNDLGNMMSSFMPESNEAKLALLAGVFGALGSPNPTLLGAIGQGGLAGVQTYANLTKLRNESLKNTMGMIQDRFITLDGQTYTDKWGILPPIDRSQMGAFVQQAFKQSGIGGMGGISGIEVPSELKVEAPTVAKAVETAKAVTPAATTEEPTQTAAEAGAEAPKVLDFSKAKSELEIKQMILGDANTWKNVPDMLSAPWLYDQAAKQQQLMTQYQNDAARSAAYNPSASTAFTAKAESAKKMMEDYRKRGDDSLNSASSAAINEFSEMQKASRKPATKTLPSGAKVATTEADIITESRTGKGPETEQSPIITKRLEAIAAEDNVLAEAAKKRPEIRQSLNAIANIIERFETGRFAEQKAEIIGYLKGAGVPIDDKTASATTSLDELVKYANTQTLGQMKQLGNKFTNLEIGNIAKTVSGAPITPEANAEIVARALAVLDYEDNYWNDYLSWKHDKEHPENLYDPFPDNNFDKKWLKEHEEDIGTFKDNHYKKIAPKGMALPPANDMEKWVDGKRYNIPGYGIRIWDAKSKTLKPEAKP